MRPIVLTVLLALAPSLASAQDTLLHLSAAGTVQSAPDQLVAELIAQNTAPSPAEAQRRVNAQVKVGMQDARAVPSVQARAFGYSVAPADDKRTRWTAQQTVELLGSDAPALLDLVNKLQGQDFATGALDWRLSPAAQRTARAAATADALKELQAQASQAASALGLHVSYIKDVQIQPREFRPLRPMGMVMAAARAAPPPEATASPQDVTVEVSAEVVLH